MYTRRKKEINHVSAAYCDKHIVCGIYSGPVLNQGNRGRNQVKFLEVSEKPTSLI